MDSTKRTGAGRRRQISQARHRRQEMTFAEVKLWDHLRGDTLGVRFRRQHPIGPFFADFAALVPRIVVETDGASHHREGRGDYDERRDRWLTSQGWTVLRFDDKEVWDEFEDVVAVIAAAVERLMGARS